MGQFFSKTYMGDLQSLLESGQFPNLWREVCTQKSCVLLLGPAGVGKSSYVNTCASFVAGSFQHLASAGKSFLTLHSPNVLCYLFELVLYRNRCRVLYTHTYQLPVLHRA